MIQKDTPTHKIIHFIKKYHLLIFLSLMLGAIALASLKPHHYLVGWDNYSAYFNLKTNIFRTFFATWRDSRGLGVPSDSEVTDIFRQLFYLVISPLVKETLLDQLYIVLALCAGVICMYLFSYKLITQHISSEEKHSHKILWFSHLFSFLASFFYLFNLSTLSTFYFPMIMFINRFFALPLTLLVFLLVLQKTKLGYKTALLILAALLISTSTYMVATILITVLLLLGTFALFQSSFKRIAIFGVLFFVVNAYWVFPFLNYTVHKSKIIRLAPTFIEANETQLNKPGTFYDFKKQLILFPNFFETLFTVKGSNAQVSFHPLANEANTFPSNIVLYVFPLLFSAGTLLLLITFRKNRHLLWIPLSLLGFVFLTLKEFSPLGFVYDYFNKLTPLFGVLFRFGDTKFHAFIAFTGSLAAAYAVYYTAKKIRARKLLQVALLLFIIIPTLFVFRHYFTGNLIGFYMYNTIPQAYFEISNTINNDKENARVLHLPFDKRAYWKSYSWGTMGSSFFHFMINKPFIDKTFEPGSMENSELHNALIETLDNIDSIDKKENQKQATKKFAQLLENYGVKYILLDETVTPDVASRGILLWGKFNSNESQLMVKNLIKYGHANEVTSYPVSTPIYTASYKDSSKPTKQSIRLIKLRDFQKKISFAQKTESIDPLIKTPLAQVDKTSLLIQVDDNNSLFYPFLRQDIVPVYEKTGIVINLKKDIPKPVTIKTAAPANTVNEKRSSYIELTGYENKTDIILNFYVHHFPQINNAASPEKVKEIIIKKSRVENRNYRYTPSSFFSDWNTLLTKQIGPLRVQLGDYIAPLPATYSSQEQHIADIITHGDNIKVKILQFDSSSPIKFQDSRLTDEPNCYQDKLTAYNHSFDNKNNLSLASQNGSTCFIYGLTSHIKKDVEHLELRVELEGGSQDLDDKYPAHVTKTTKPQLKKTIESLSKPNTLYLCIKEPDIDTCYNKHQYINASGRNIVIVPLEKPLDQANNLLLLGALKNISYQKQNLTINKAYVDTYTQIKSDEIKLPLAKTSEATVPADFNSVKISLRRPLSIYSFYQHKLDGWQVPNGLCEEATTAYRTFRTLPNGDFLAHLENCYNNITHVLPFSSSNFYLWSVDYHLFSGQFPQFLLDDGFHHYKNEFFSLQQGYPDIEGFKEFQNPEMFLPSQENIQEKLYNPTYHTASVIIPPQAAVSDQKRKDFSIYHQGENEGIMSIKNFNVIELPQSWYSLAIGSNNTEKSYAKPRSYSFTQILPSLWQVKIHKKAEKQTLLLHFNEAYDKQWGVFDNWFNLLVGPETNNRHVKCNMLTNCFEITPNKKNTTVYLFYIPERLSFLGISITAIGLLSFFIFFSRTKRKAS